MPAVQETKGMSNDTAKKRVKFNEFHSLLCCWTNGTRTHNDRTKTCSVTITPWSNPLFVVAKVRNNCRISKFLNHNSYKTCL